MANCRRTVSGEGYNPERKSSHTIIRQEPKKPEMQNTRDGTQKEDKERTKSRTQNQKEGVVAWASCVRRKSRIQIRRPGLDGVWGWGGDDRRTESGK